MAGIWHFCGSGVGWWLWLQLDPLAWESPYAAVVALENTKRTKKKKKKVTIIIIILVVVAAMVKQTKNKKTKNTKREDYI